MGYTDQVCPSGVSKVGHQKSFEMNGCENFPTQYRHTYPEKIDILTLIGVCGTYFIVQ